MRWLPLVLLAACGPPEPAATPCQGFAGESIPDTCEGDTVCVARFCEPAFPRDYRILAVGPNVVLILNGAELGRDANSVTVTHRLQEGDALEARAGAVACGMDMTPEQARAAYRLCGTVSLLVTGL